MEAISNVASAAVKAVWGASESIETREEPISGVNGDASKGEPFDAGNMVQSKQEQRAGAIEPPESNDSAAAPKSLDDNSSGQNDTSGSDDPKTDPEPPQQNVDLKQPGPKPLEAVAKEHGGDAGGAEGDSTEDDGANEIGEEGEDSLQRESDGSGTGEQWVKSSGLQADGGDFDAAAPGAGKEADRLLETKGIKKDESPIASGSSNHPADDNWKPKVPKDKPSIGDRLKAKLHVH